MKSDEEVHETGFERIQLEVMSGMELEGIRGQERIGKDKCWALLFCDVFLLLSAYGMVSPKIIMSPGWNQ